MLFKCADQGDQIIFITMRGPQDAGREWSVENTVKLLETLPFQYRLITYCTRPRFLYDDDPIKAIKRKRDQPWTESQ